jgi:glycosyltransferase involved in cell wall biosynthesis
MNIEPGMTADATADRSHASAPLTRESPTVSVIVPAYNTARFIPETLQSVFAQTLRDYEVIVINDGSPDTEHLRAVIAPYRQRIVYIEQENSGPAGARNSGIRAARGEFVAFLDGDDCWLSGFLQEQLTLLRQEPPADLVFCDAEVFGDGIADAPTCMEMQPCRGPVTLESLLVEQCVVLMPTVVARKQAVIEAGLFDESLRAAEDYDLWLRLVHRGARIRYHRNVLGRYRIRPGSLSSSRTGMYGSLVEVLAKVEKTFDLDAATRALVQHRLERARGLLALAQGEEYLSQGQFAQASHFLESANAFFGSKKLSATLLGLRFAPRLTLRAVRFYKGWIHAQSPGGSRAAKVTWAREGAQQRR